MRAALYPREKGEGGREKIKDKKKDILKKKRKKKKTARDKFVEEQKR